MPGRRSHLFAGVHRQRPMQRPELHRRAVPKSLRLIHLLLGTPQLAAVVASLGVAQRSRITDASTPRQQAAASATPPPNSRSAAWRARAATPRSVTRLRAARARAARLADRPTTAGASRLAAGSGARALALRRPKSKATPRARRRSSR